MSAPGKPRLRPLGEEFTDLPNIVTLIRIGFIPPVLLTIDNSSARLSALSCVLFLIAAVSDALDGYLARRLDLITVVGKFLDPLADKLIVLSTLVYLVAADRAPAWLVVVLMMRELAVTGLRAIASQQGLVIAAGQSGKLKTALQLVGIAFLLLHFRYRIIGLDYHIDCHLVGTYLLYLSLIMSVLSAVEYFRFFVEAADRQAGELAEQGITRAHKKEQARRLRAKLRALRRSRKRRAHRRSGSRPGRAASDAGGSDPADGPGEPDGARRVDEDEPDEDSEGGAR